MPKHAGPRSLSAHLAYYRRRIRKERWPRSMHAWPAGHKARPPSTTPRFDPTIPSYIALFPFGRVSLDYKEHLELGQGWRAKAKTPSRGRGNPASLRYPLEPYRGALSYTARRRPPVFPASHKRGRGGERQSKSVASQATGSVPITKSVASFWTRITRSEVSEADADPSRRSWCACGAFTFAQSSPFLLHVG